MEIRFAEPHNDPACDGRHHEFVKGAWSTHLLIGMLYDGLPTPPNVSHADSPEAVMNCPKCMPCVKREATRILRIGMVP